MLCEPTNARIEGGCQGSMQLQVELRGVAAFRAFLDGAQRHSRCGDVLQLLASYQPQQIEVDGLIYREGLNAVMISGGIAGNVIPDVVSSTSTTDSHPTSHQRRPRRTCEQFDGIRRITDVAAGARPGLDQPAAAEFLRAVGGPASAKLGWTDVARFSAMGIPAVNFGPGDPRKAHADDEFCPAEDVGLPRCPDSLAELTSERRNGLVDWVQRVGLERQQLSH